MFRIRITPRWELERLDGTAPQADTTALIALLAAIAETGAIAEAARALGLSYRNAWGQIKQAEALFGQPLLVAGRGRGSTLTPLAEKLIWADKRVAARLSPLLQSLASELEGELERTLPAPPRVLRLHASHGFAVAALLEELQAQQLPLDLRYRNSFESVAALAHGECELAGFHVPIGEFEAAAAERYRSWLQPEKHRLVHLAVRTQGLFAAPGNPRRIGGIEDLKRPDLRFVNRPAGSGTRLLTELLLARHGLAPRQVNGFDNAEFTHAAVAAYIASGMADVGLGVQTAAQRFGLYFIPLLRERYFLAFNAADEGRPDLRSLLALMRSVPYRSRVAALPGYEAAHTGEVCGVREAGLVG
ncbi:substrate-binding domain-containing protein [uncultured Azohydromonas sp.]|jgi:Periplasmic molybdate-binding protein/domain|uniref:helix-turn-helix transcriptional regulator n=1 Tax=uncultured Azohydromonas sp. TaxID=487342 RepID=UPI0026320864|nr:substrate-binding domain-containing protein [uncultured Azohydromonas sp.]